MLRGRSLLRFLCEASLQLSVGAYCQQGWGVETQTAHRGLSLSRLTPAHSVIQAI